MTLPIAPRNMGYVSRDDARLGELLQDLTAKLNEVIVELEAVKARVSVLEG